jgi:hypothetical protein
MVCWPAESLWVDWCFQPGVCHQTRASEFRARKLLLETSTSWWKSLRPFRPAAHQGFCVAGRVQFGGRSGRNTACFGPKKTISWSRTFPKFPKNKGLRPLNYDPSMRLRALSEFFERTAYIYVECLWI